MKPDEYLKMLDNRIKDYEVNMAIAYRNYLAEKSKLHEAMNARLIYEQLLKEEKSDDRSAL